MITITRAAFRAEPDRYVLEADREPVAVVDEEGVTRMVLTSSAHLARHETPDCLRVLSAEELAAVPVPTPEQIRAALRRAGDDLRAMARRDLTPIGSSDAAAGIPPHPRREAASGRRPATTRRRA